MSANDDLHSALDDRSLKRVEKAVANGADLEAVNDEGNTALIASLYAGEEPWLTKREEKLALWLLEQGADVHATTEEGQTPLHIAAESKSVTLIRALAERGAKITAATDGATPLHAGVHTHGEDTEMWELLMELGCGLEDRADGLTVLMCAVGVDNPFAVEWFIERGADVKATDNDGKTALDLARKYKNKDCVTILEKVKA